MNTCQKDNFIGRKFGRLKVLKIDHFKTYNKNTRYKYYLCQCECGNTCVVSRSNLSNGHTKSCGCIHTEKLIERNIKHNLRNTRLYSIWSNMKQRCYYPKHNRYKNYGDRGIKVCDEWLDKENGFMNFYNWAISNKYKEGLSIDRIDVNGNYEPSNCRWSNSKEQSRNTSRNKYITFNGETLCYTDWAKKIGVSPATISNRIKKGLPIECVLNKK